MLQAIARLAHRGAPTNHRGCHLGLHGGRDLRHPGRQEPVPGGFQDPQSESAQAIKALTDKFGQSGQKMLILVTAPAGAGSEQARRVGTDIVDQLQQSPLVFDVSSAWTVPSYEPPTAAADLVSDLLVMEAITIPPSFLVLVWVFGGHLASCTQLRIVR
jgi:putative drug exporter of the RND superfamily